jgi:hypothetical protein
MKAFCRNGPRARGLFQYFALAGEVQWLSSKMSFDRFERGFPVSIHPLIAEIAVGDQNQRWGSHGLGRAKACQDPFECFRFEGWLRELTGNRLDEIDIGRLEALDAKVRY